MGPLILLYDPGLLQTPQQVYDQVFLTDGVCSEPKTHNHEELQNDPGSNFIYSK